jgi:hypothetical protein
VINIAYITLLMDIPDKFRPAIIDSIPKLVTLLTDRYGSVREAGATALTQLSEKGKRE